MQQSFDPARFTVAELVCHKPPMLLIHDVLSIEEKSINVKIDLSKPSLFHSEEGTVPSFVGLEYIAQSTAALVGYHRKRQGLEVKKGFLLGTRVYESKVAYFDASEILSVKINEVITDDMIGVYQGEILSKERVIASAQIKAVMPEDYKRLFER